jgi:hypothetical protein
MPEYIILISAIACVGSGVGFYFNRNNAAALGIAIFGFIGFLYGIGQYIERDNAEARALGFADAAEKRLALDAGIKDAVRWKQFKSGANARAPVKVPGDVATLPLPQKSEAEKLDSLAPAQPGAQEMPLGTVTISNFTSRKLAGKFVELSGTVSNRNQYAIRNIVIRCGDKSFAAGDVTAMIEKTIPARSDLQIAGLKMGPIRPELPPTTCLIAKFDRAD